MVVNLSRIILKKGDLTEFDGDAIVNAANTDLILGGGVAGAIRRKGGDLIQKECQKIGRIPLGEAVVTQGGRLKAKYVIHAAAMGFDEPCTEDSIRKSVKNALLRAKEREFEKVAMPAIGMGIAGFPLQPGAKILLKSVIDFLLDNSFPSYVYVYLWDEETFEVFRRTLNELRQ